MARARQLKPGFFKNEGLAQCSMAARLLFAGIWTLADRDGRLEDRPLRVKAELFPYDSVNVDKLIGELAAVVDDDGAPAFLVRYLSAGHRYIQIMNFVKHQNPHMREPASSIPAPGEHGASTVPVQDETGTGPAPSPLPLTSNPLPLPPTGQGPGAAALAESVIEAWNRIAAPKGLPVVRLLNDGRRKLIGARLRDMGGLAGLEELFGKVAASPFLLGDGDRGWKADFDWVMKAEHAPRILEGRYEKGRPKATTGDQLAAAGRDYGWLDTAPEGSAK